ARLLSLPRALVMLLGVVAWCLYLWQWLFAPRIGLSPVVGAVVLDWAVALGAGFVLLLAIASPGVATILTRRPLLWLGKISYSLYLTHILVLLTVLHLAAGVVPLPVALISVPLLSLAVATLVNRWLEIPS